MRSKATAIWVVMLALPVPVEAAPVSPCPPGAPPGLREELRRGGKVRAFIGRHTGERVPGADGRPRYAFVVDEWVRGQGSSPQRFEVICVAAPRRDRRVGVLVDSAGRVFRYAPVGTLLRASRPLPRQLSARPTRFVQETTLPAPGGRVRRVLIGLDVGLRPTSYRDLGSSATGLRLADACPGGTRVLLGDVRRNRVVTLDVETLRTVGRLSVTGGVGACADPLGRAAVGAGIEYLDKRGLLEVDVVDVYFAGRAPRRLTAARQASAVASGRVFFVTKDRPRVIRVATPTGSAVALVRLPFPVAEMKASRDGRYLMAYTPNPLIPGSVRLVTYDTRSGRIRTGMDRSRGQASFVAGRICWSEQDLRCLTRDLRRTVRVSPLAGRLTSTIDADYFLAETGAVSRIGPGLRLRLRGFAPDPLNLTALDRPT